MSFGQLGAGFARLGLGVSGPGGGSSPIGNTATRAPTARDDITRGNAVGRLWLDTSTSTFYSNTSNSAGAAVWSNLGAVTALPVQASGVSWTAVYGTKALTSAWLSGNLFDIIRGSDAAVQTFAATAGEPNIAAIQAFLTGTEGYIYQWYDQSGNGNNATVTSGHNPGIRIVNGRVALVGANIVQQGVGVDAYINIPSTTINLKAMTLVSVIRPFQSVPIGNTSASTGSRQLYGIYNGSDGTAFKQALNGNVGSGQQEIVELSVFTEYPASYTADSGFVVTGMVGSGSDQVQFQNEQTTSAGAANPAGSVTTTAGIGRSHVGTEYGLNDEVYAFMLAGASALSPTALLNTRKSLYALFSIAPQYINDNYIAVGDSLTQGYQSLGADGFYGWNSTTQIQNLLNRPVRVSNFGVSQANIAYLISNRAAWIGPLSGARTNTLRIATGTNDVASAGSGTSAWTSLATYITSAQGSGFTSIIVDTLITNVTFDGSPAAEAERQIYNGLIRSNAAGMGYVVSDVGGNSTPLGTPGASGNTTYFVGDGVHLTAAGQLVVAQYDAAALNGILGA